MASRLASDVRRGSLKLCAGPCGRWLEIETSFPSKGRYSNGTKRTTAKCRDCSRTAGSGTEVQTPRLHGSAWPSVEALELEWNAATPSPIEPADETTDRVVVIPKPEPRIEVVAEKVTRVEEHRLKKQVADLKAQIKSLTEEASERDKMAEFIREVSAMPVVPGIEPRERSSGLAEATPLVLGSDWHIESEVRPEQVAFRNRYNLDISKRRMERFFEATRWAINHQREVFKIRDLVLWLGGDLITGWLHEDNVITNLLSPVEAVAYAQASISDGIRYLLQDNELERIAIPCNDGNHGRLSKKINSAARIESSIEWLLYYNLMREFAREPRIQFQLPTSAFNFFEIYGRTVRFTHGDRFKYSGGIGGITIPMIKALNRWDSLRPAALTCMGHWHQRINLPGAMVNGSLIGFDPFAMDIGATFEPPVQSLRMLEPKRFCSADIPLNVSDREDDQASWAA